MILRNGDMQRHPYILQWLHAMIVMLCNYIWINPERLQLFTDFPVADYGLWPWGHENYINN